MRNNKWFNALLILLLVLIDGRTSNLFSQVFNYQLALMSHLVLLYLLYQTKREFTSSLYWQYALVGILADSYYFSSIGLMTFLFPIAIFILRQLFLFGKFKGIQLFLVFFLLNFCFDNLLYGLARLYQLNFYPFAYFISYSLAPSLLYNSFLFVLLYLLGQRK